MLKRFCLTAGLMLTTPIWAVDAHDDLIQTNGDITPPPNWQRITNQLRAIDSADLDPSRIDQLVETIQSGQRTDNDDNLLCIGALSAPYAAAFALGVVPNPPWDYLLGQVPAYAANLGLKFCPPSLEAPDPRGVRPNVNTDDGLNCAYDFSQPVIAGTRSDFMGLPLKVLGDWTFTSSPDSIGLGTPSVFHYNTDVSVRVLLPGEAPPGFLQEVPEPEFVAEIGPFGIRAPDNELFSTLGCLLDGSTPFNNEGGPCPIDLDRKIRLPVGTHLISWRAETEIGLLDTLPPIYVPGKPPGSKKETAKAILQNIYEAAAGSVAGSFLRSYPTGAVNIKTQVVRVFDTTDPELSFSPPALQTFRVEAQEPGGQSTFAFVGALRESVVATDTCNRTPTVTAPIPPFLPLGSHTIIWTARDRGPSPSGGVNEDSIAQTVIIEDTQPPQVKSPPSIVIESDFAPVQVDTGSPQVFDVVDLEPVVEFDGPADFPFGVTTVRWRATDASGNQSPWVEQTINVKLTGSNHSPVADNANAAGLSFEEITVSLSGSDADNDPLYFYIDDQPDEGFFIAPLLPTFVEDLRVEAQGDASAICLSGGTLPPQNYVFEPEYITTNDSGVTFVIDLKIRCDDDSSTGINTDDARIARIGPDGALQAEYNLGSQRPLRLSFHPGGLPSAPDPFLYWLDPDSNPTRLFTVDQMLSGSQHSFRVDASAASQSTPVDAAIDAQGIVYVTGSVEMDAYDFEGRTFDVLDYLGPVDPLPSELSRN
ncbi:MAG: HYR domain-containing protein, partial [Pseudomonadota bacterium]